MPSRLATPIAILAGSGVIAAAVYFGLNDRGGGSEAGADAPAAPPVFAPAAASDDASAHATAPAPPKHDVEGAARAAIEGQRKEMVERCWAPAIAASSEPASSEYLVDVTFDKATGKALSRGVSEIRGVPSRPDVAQCLRELPLDYEIAPPGENARIELRISFP